MNMSEASDDTWQSGVKLLHRMASRSSNNNDRLHGQDRGSIRYDDAIIPVEYDVRLLRYNGT